MEQFNEKLLEVMLGNGLVSELAYRFPLLLSWLTWVAASIVCLLVALVACLKWFLLSEWEIKETFSTMVFQGYLYYLITPTSKNQVLKDYVIILWVFSWDPYLKINGTTLVTQRIMQCWPNPTELRSMDCYIQIFMYLNSKKVCKKFLRRAVIIILKANESSLVVVWQ